MKRWVFAPMLAMVCLGLAMPLAGCHQDENALSPEEEKKSDRLDEIAKKTGGDWAKVTPEDKDYILKNLAHDENSAKMLLMMKTGGFQGKVAAPGAPPTGK